MSGATKVLQEIDNPDVVLISYEDNKPRQLCVLVYLHAASTLLLYFNSSCTFVWSSKVGGFPVFDSIASQRLDFHFLFPVSRHLRVKNPERLVFCSLQTCVCEAFSESVQHTKTNLLLLLS